MEISLLFEQFCEYSQYHRGYLPDTIARYRTGIRLFCRTTGVRDIAECTDQLIRRFFHEGSSKRNWSPATFRTYYNTLVVFFRWCVSRGLLATNPAEGMELPRLRKHLPERLTADESEQLLARIANYPYQSTYQRTRDHAMIATILFAGLRRQELLRLQVRDCDVEHRTVFVRQGKGGKDRIVPMHWQLAGSNRL
jgi:site-specific recombinase XerD